MALVITLILLSVTLVMAIAFLAISRRERVSVTTANEVTTARLAAETALDAAQAQIIANIGVSSSALYDYHLLVSTNYINSYGFVPGSFSPTNVNYDYYFNALTPITGQDFAQNVANLQFLPRAPVMVGATASDTNGGRFYLDLNRNNFFEDTSPSVAAIEVDSFGNGFTNGFTRQVGDPQWVGVLQYPGATHSADNRFVSRYAYIALPVGEALDINFIHNQAISGSLNPISVISPDGYLRNQGVGSYEINLAAFLADLNTNQWCFGLTPNNTYYAYYRPVSYVNPFSSANLGYAFEDARAILSWRYNYNYSTPNIDSVNFIFGPNVFNADNIDEYSDGPLQTQSQNINESLIGNADNTALPWPGANNPNRFFTLSDFFDPTKSSGGAFGGFTNRLLNAGNTVSGNGLRPTYDRYTFYRMLDQLATDSEPDTARMNVNFRNITNGVILSGLETNQYPWSAIEFFTNAADRLLKIYTTNWLGKGYQNYTNTFGTSSTTTFGVDRIPVYVDGRVVYSPAVNRLLQLAANIYDSTSDDPYPSVFRPRFTRTGTNVYIMGFDYVDNIANPPSTDVRLGQPFTIEEYSQLGVAANVNIYGVPWIVGAKKGLPAFNQFTTRNDFQVTRKLQVTRNSVQPYNATTAANFFTNVMYVMSISNHMGFSFWNSYSSNYVSPTGANIRIAMYDNVDMWLTNALTTIRFGSTNFAFAPAPFTVWPGSQWDTTQTPDSRIPSPNAFVRSTFHFPFLPESAYVFSSASFNPTANNPQFETNIVPRLNSLPHFGLVTSNRLQAFIVDGTRIIDYVHFSGPSGVRDLNQEIAERNYDGVNIAPYRQWITNSSGGLNSVSQGLLNQIQVSRVGPSVAPNGQKWVAPPNMPAGVAGPAAEAAYFSGFFTPTWIYGAKVYTNTATSLQVPYTPTRTAYQYTVWQANDPLVHYLASDLSMQKDGETGLQQNDDPSTQPPPTFHLYDVGERYQPWGRGGLLDGLINVDPNPYNLGVRDPQVWGSDYWDFPTNRLPSAGWLGRVHRGTPWQTVYLKATNFLEYVDMTGTFANTNVGYVTWTNWTGNGNAYDSANMKPTQDTLLFDVFTTSPHPNASRGTLSVNQKNLAAWSAVLSGMMVLTNLDQADAPNYKIVPLITNTVVEPAGLDSVNSPLAQIVDGPDGINQTRANTIIYPNGVFTHIGDILRVPALTEKSPFINRADSVNTDDRLRFEISDQQYEWLPQQVLGLLRVSSAPRYAIYALGQTLKPAPGGTVLDSQFFGLVTNYQVVAETATRAIITVQPFIKNGVTNYTTRVESVNVLPPE